MIVVHQFVQDTVDAIALLHKHDRITQELILLYSAIDTLAWLGPRDPQTTGVAFRQWVDQYLLPHRGLACNFSHLYSARCGLLHTHTAESTSTTSGTARQIWYWTGENSRRLLEYQPSGRTDVVIVRVVDLEEALRRLLNASEKSLIRTALEPKLRRKRCVAGWPGFLRRLPSNEPVSLTAQVPIPLFYRALRCGVHDGGCGRSPWAP